MPHGAGKKMMDYTEEEHEKIMKEKKMPMKPMKKPMMKAKAKGKK